MARCWNTIKPYGAPQRGELFQAGTAFQGGGQTGCRQEQHTQVVGDFQSGGRSMWIPNFKYEPLTLTLRQGV